MTQKRLIELALSAVKHKRIVMAEAHEKYYETNPRAAENLFKISLELTQQQIELEQMLMEVQE